MPYGPYPKKTMKFATTACSATETSQNIGILHEKGMRGNNKGADQTARMRLLVCIFVVACNKFRFSCDEAHVSLITDMDSSTSSSSSSPVDR